MPQSRENAEVAGHREPAAGTVNGVVPNDAIPAADWISLPATALLLKGGAFLPQATTWRIGHALNPFRPVALGSVIRRSGPARQPARVRRPRARQDPSAGRFR
ncbi:hypothetical protein GCM10010430_65990 [Kitasatospora cystarginea]|uniref:Uncharacterized protein n=1 Tax=Kitasatospora cystarginea TaxID=58350 RepID=A0ABN3EUT9_9ACTN